MMTRLPLIQSSVVGGEMDDDEEFVEAPSTPTTWYEPLTFLSNDSEGREETEENNKVEDSQEEKPVRVYADGIYDLFHFGHARALEQAKKLFPNTYLLVGCCNDETTHMYKGKTVMTEAERYESLRHCKWVDEVIPDAPWVLSKEFIDQHNIDYVAHDALPYADTSGAGNDVYEFVSYYFEFKSRLIVYWHVFHHFSHAFARNDFCKQVKSIGKFKETKRTDGVSTSEIIMRILKEYNEYVMRNLARGYSRKDLGVSYVKEKQLRVNMGITKLREKVKEHQENVGKKLYTVAKLSGMSHDEWVENADRWVSGFLEKFEEGCHIMETAIKDKIQEGLKRQQSRQQKSILNVLEEEEPETSGAPPIFISELD